MSILNVTTQTIGSIGIEPRIIHIDTNNTPTEVLATGFLNSIVSQGTALSEKDLAAVTTKDTPNSTEVKVGWYEVTRTGSNWSLSSSDNPGSVDLPTIPGHFPIFKDTIGTMSDAPTTATNDGIIQSGRSGVVAGEFRTMAVTPGSGSFGIRPGNNSADIEVNIFNQSHAQDTFHSLPDPGVGNATILTAPIANGDAASSIISVRVNVDAASLALLGTVVLYPSSGVKQYKVLDITTEADFTGLNFTVGDRLINIEDGTNVLTQLVSADLLALTNNRWGDAKLLSPLGTGWGTASQPGADLFAQYTGGLTDYATGNFFINLLIQEIV